MTDIPLIPLGGTMGKPLLHLAPANGFVPEIYLPLLRPLFADFQVVAISPRALWQESPPVIETHTDWRDDVTVMHDGFTQHHLTSVIGVGHSLGGIITLLAALQHPQMFRAVILLDPTILIRQMLEYTAILRQSGRALDNPLAQGTMRRRRTFASVEAAFTNFRSKAVFADWSDETLRLYADYGTRQTDTGERTLAWSPEWEAFYFSTIITDLWDSLVARLHEIHRPALILRGETSDTYTAESAHEVAEAWPQATHQEIAGHGHLFPLSAPEMTAQKIRLWLSQQGLM